MKRSWLGSNAALILVFIDEIMMMMMMIFEGKKNTCARHMYLSRVMRTLVYVTLSIHVKQATFHIRSRTCYPFLFNVCACTIDTGLVCTNNEKYITEGC